MDRVATGLDQFTQVPRVLPAEEVALGALGLQSIGKGQAAHDVAAADFERGVGTKGDHLPLQARGYRRFTHAPPSCWACQALNSHSARCQSSGVSISWTRWRGSFTGTACSLKIGVPLLQAAARPQ